MTEDKLRTRYRIVFLYYEFRNGKCLTEETPEYFKLSGAVDGDAFQQYVNFAKEVHDTIPRKCIIDDGHTGVCIATYIMKEKFVYHKKIYHIFKTRKDGVKIAYQVDAVTEKKKQMNYKAAMRRHKAQVRREKKAAEKHKVAKKKTVKEFEMYKGCYSPDLAYKGR